MSISENERYWQHRAQRAEALLRRARPILAGQQRVSWQLVDDMDAALATPPPGGEPNLDEHPTDLASMTRREYLESQGKTIDAPQTPEQAHGEALALFDGYVERGHLFWNTYKRQDAIAKIRQALTASGVPYVPGNIRELPDKIRREANYVEPDRFQPADSYSMGVDDMANMLEAALASAPADGYKLVPVEPTEAMMEEYRRAFVSSDRFDGAAVYRAMIEAAPTDGREHE